MQKETSSDKFISLALGSVLAILAVNAFAGGYFGLAGAKNVPLEWLDGSPFSSYFWPSLFLFTIVGGSALYAAIQVFGHRHTARQAALVCGTIVLIWIVVQIAVIGYVSWLQPATTAAGIVILTLARSIHES